MAVIELYVPGVAAVGAFLAWRSWRAGASFEVVAREKRDATYFYAEGRPREPIPRKRRLLVFARDGGKCKLTGERVSLSGKRFPKAHMGHGVPNSYGGSNLAKNLAVQAARANLSLDTAIIAPAVRYMQRRREKVYFESREQMIRDFFPDCETLKEVHRERSKRSGKKA